MNFMSKNLLFICILGVGTSKAQVVNLPLELRDVCSYYGEELPNAVHTFSSDNEAETVIRTIMSATGLPKNFKIRAAGIPNAAAVIKGSDRYILYNQNFIHSLKAATRSDWSPYSVMAHEIAHHLAGHTLNNSGSRPSLELEADKYSGFILAKLGASLEDAQATIASIGDLKPSVTHPAKHDRLAAIANGWFESCAKSNGGCGGQNEIINTTASDQSIGSLEVRITNQEILDQNLHPLIKIMNIKPKYYPGIPLSPGEYHVRVDLNNYSSFDSWIKVDSERKIVNVYLKEGGKVISKSSKGGLLYGAVGYSRQGFLRGYLGYSKQDAKNRAISACKSRNKKYCVVVSNFTECVAIAIPQAMAHGKGATKKIAINEVKNMCRRSFGGYRCDIKVSMCTER